MAAVRGAMSIVAADGLGLDVALELLGAAVKAGGSRHVGHHFRALAAVRLCAGPVRVRRGA